MPAVPVRSGALTRREASWHTHEVDRNHYQFRSEWIIEAAPSLVYEALERFEDYPQWWPEVRSYRLLTKESCEVTCRSVLPYNLTFVLRPSRRDRDAGVLEASMTGDLEGFSRWTLLDHPSGTRLVFDEDVRANRRLLRWLAPMARSVFRGNHAIMMRHGSIGLSGYMATFDPSVASDRVVPLASRRVSSHRS
jgi:Polyketide cyclase / dehydrase and lipid transport